MLSQLEFATRAHHVAADAGRIALLGTQVCGERYLDYLSRTYAFEAPIEARWRATPGLENVIDVEPRLRSGYLAADLRVLGEAVGHVAPSAFYGVEQALGWMYVVERGRRMNGMLLRHLQRRLPGLLAAAGNYLSASSPAGTRWQRLGEGLDAVAKDHTIEEQIINAAHRAFRVLRGVPMAVAA